MSTLHCMFCGGKECKYENYKLWNTEKSGKNAIDGLYSSWITPEILAMQRPSSRLIKEFDLTNVFQKNGIGAVFNLQQSGEHASCGDGIHPSGFSYLPEEWMDKGIYYYNFGWQDMETPEMQTILDIVQVMAYSIKKTGKIAVHCHAGLGRTGLSIACYLIFSESIKAESAILLVRSKRPGSVQTQKQVQFVNNFETFLKQLRKVYPGIHRRGQKVVITTETMTFQTAITNQLRYLHGLEQRVLNGVPKVIYRIINRLCDMNINNEVPECSKIIYDSFTQFEGMDVLPVKTSSIMYDLNEGSWNTLESERDPHTLVNLLLYWFVALKEPLITDANLLMINDSKMQWDTKIQTLNKHVFETINYMIELIRKLDYKEIEPLFLKLAIVLTNHRSTLERKFQYFEPATEKEPVLKRSATTEALKQSIQSGWQATYQKGSILGSQIAAKINTTSMSYFTKRVSPEVKSAEQLEESKTGDELKTSKSQDELKPTQTGEEIKPSETEQEDKAPENDTVPEQNDTAELKETAHKEETQQTENAEIVDTAKAVPAQNESPSDNSPVGQVDMKTSKSVNEISQEQPLIPLNKCIELFQYIYRHYACKDGSTRAIVLESMTPVNPAIDTLNAAEALEFLGFGSKQNLADSFSKTLHPPKPQETTLMSSVVGVVNDLTLDVNGIVSQISDRSKNAISSLSGSMTSLNGQ
ncbi:hypothetical protein EDD86DRAFT_222199 [Gorgonomyces haynaldii]|nr:hypothetical protein EDD86DRAFT_222199 [Gorgonomyces haynaldii]